MKSLKRLLVAALVSGAVALPISNANAFWGGFWPWDWGGPGYYGYPYYGYGPYGGYPGYWGGYPYYGGGPWGGGPWGGGPWSWW